MRTGLEVLLQDRAEDFRGARLGLVVHPASVTRDLVHAVDAIAAHPFLSLVTLFGPQHGARGEKQDNMVESASYQDARTGLPVHSLYGDVRKPTPAMLEGLDVVLFDLQDVGSRIYTFAWTLCLLMDACRDAGVGVVVLDRPNPVGGALREGPLLREGFESFVGLHPVPLRHGLTLGELALHVNLRRGLGAELQVIACDGWDRRQWFDETGLPWVLPSPNLPTLDSCAVYPGMVLFEGTTLSEGRGTTRPFEFVGAPHLDGQRLADALRRRDLPGVHFRAVTFEPTFQKHAGAACGGVQLHVTDRDALRPVSVALAVLREAANQSPGTTLWREPPFEYETLKPPIDILWGSDALRRGIDAGQEPEELLAGVDQELLTFADEIAGSLLYR